MWKFWRRLRACLQGDHELQQQIESLEQRLRLAAEERDCLKGQIEAYREFVARTKWGWAAEGLQERFVAQQLTERL